jgi:hypothetical protein
MDELSDVRWEGRVCPAIVDGIIFKTERNSADRKSQERNPMVFHIGTNLEGELCARSEARCVRVWRRSDLLRNGTTEEQLEGMGYCPLRKRFPGCSIKGDKQFEDTLYTTTIDKLI